MYDRKIMPFYIQFMRYPVVHHYFKTGIEKNFHRRMNGRIPLPDYTDLITDPLDKAHTVLSQNEI